MNQPIAFANAHVIPMDRERLLAKQTVLVEGDRVVALGPADQVAIPEGAEVIDARGAYLMPGLADMHMHIESISRTFEGSGQLRLFLAEGVTTTRNLSATPEHLSWARKVVRGELLGPTLINGRMLVGLPDELRAMARTFRVGVVLAPALLWFLLWLLLWAILAATGNGAQFVAWSRFILPGLALLLSLGAAAAWLKIVPLNLYTSRRFPFATIPESVAEARRYVRASKEAGYDFVKLYDWLSPEAYLAAADEARRLDFYAIGHLLDELSLEAIFEGGLREAAHVDEYTDVHLTGESSPRAGFKAVALDYETVARSAAVTRAHDVMVVSNLVADETVLELLDDPAQGLARPEYAIVPLSVRERWLRTGRLVQWQAQRAWRRDTWRPFLMAMARALYEAGVSMLTGTDMTVEGILPGHIHRELELLVEAGLPPYAALEAATKNAAISVRRMGGDSAFGIVAPGRRADLLLLQGNPLENVSHTRRRLGVMVRGRWFPQPELDALVQEYVAGYQSGDRPEQAATSDPG